MTRYSALSTDASASASASAAGELPFGQRAIKVIANLCFSAFVLAVLVITVVAVTYQPPDPWLNSSAALTDSLSSTLPNSTFHPDDSVLPTGEDLIPLNSSLIPVNSTIQSSPIIPDSDFEASSDECNEDSPVNCSDPRVLTAVKAFNVKAFTRRSIIFLSYEKPVAGGKQGECDVAWRFRNRKEKSWRRYKDYRRFRLTKSENCTLEITWVGKFRSGTNAAKSPKNPPKSRNSNPSPSIQVNTDSEINDTIPTVGSESEFKKGKYLYYTRGGDYCKSMNQFIWSFLCGLGEAQFLNRTFVIDLNICLSGAYNPFYGKDEEGKDFRFYFDFEHLKESAKVVEESEFLRDWRKWDKTTKNKNKNKKNYKNNDKISVRKVPTYKMSPMQLKKEKSTIIWRQFDGPEPENYWYRVCEGPSAKYIQRPWQAIWKSKHLMNIVSQIAGKMDWEFDAVHVVRGWKAQNKQLWPNLDADTSPENLVEKLTRVLKPMRNLYVATNEPFYNHFDKLRSHFKVHLLEDYKEMWGENSEWFNETKVLNGGKKVDFDGYMRVAIDTEVLYRAKTQIETFNNLTMDCKDGVNTC